MTPADLEAELAILRTRVARLERLIDDLGEAHARRFDLHEEHDRRLGLDPARLAMLAEQS